MNFLNNVNVGPSEVQHSHGTSLTIDVDVATTNPTQLYSFPHAEYQAIKVLAITSSATDYSARELLGIHDGVEGYATEYALVATDLETGDDDYNLEISGSDAILSVTPATATARNITLFITLIA